MSKFVKASFTDVRINPARPDEKSTLVKENIEICGECWARRPTTDPTFTVQQVLELDSPVYGCGACGKDVPMAYEAALPKDVTVMSLDELLDMLVSGPGMPVPNTQQPGGMKCHKCGNHMATCTCVSAYKA